MNADYVAVKINADQLPATAERYGVTASADHGHRVAGGPVAGQHEGMGGRRPVCGPVEPGSRRCAPAEGGPCPTAQPSAAAGRGGPAGDAARNAAAEHSAGWWAAGRRAASGRDSVSAACGAITGAGCRGAGLRRLGRAGCRVQIWSGNGTAHERPDTVHRPRRAANLPVRRKLIRRKASPRKSIRRRP